MRGFCERVPGALEEAAQVDGASRLVALARVVIPVAMNSFIAQYDIDWGSMAAAVVSVVPTLVLSPRFAAISSRAAPQRP
ncbi:hypothetical protein ABGB18_13765 [Nonomuraea sp. B12E4]|uniref:hypothetical protein n=1 Tax=Nonomuraea sp. B12E4 TaxID=3153564 RepID=UPI00325E6397